MYLSLVVHPGNEHDRSFRLDDAFVKLALTNSGCRLIVAQRLHDFLHGLVELRLVRIDLFDFREYIFDALTW